MHVLKLILAGIHARSWWSAIGVSALFIVFLGYLVDWHNVSLHFNAVSLLWLCLALIVLALEGVFTAFRIKSFTPGDQPISECLRVNAWFVMMLIIIPGRLGEIAVVVLYRHYLHQKTGSALMNVIAQRLLDLIILGLIFLLAITAINFTEISRNMYIAVICAIFLFVFIIRYLLVLLTLLSLLFLSIKKKTGSLIAKHILKLSLQARTWFKHHMTRHVLMKSIFLTMAKWICNIAGLMLAFASFGLEFSNIKLLFLATIYNVLGVVPLQTIGGIGVSEVGLSGILYTMGLPLDEATATSIYMRFVAILNPVLFFAMVMLWINVIKKRLTGKPALNGK